MNEEVKRRKDAREPVKYCAYCGAQLHRKRFENGRLEDIGVFERRKYCDRECMRKGFLKIGEHDQTISNAHTTAREINEMIMHKDKCEICGSKKNLDIHHKDGNWRNNSPENLQCLCRSCHMKAHKSKGVCRICGAPMVGQGLCNKHLIRYKKYGNPYLVYGKDERYKK